MTASLRIDPPALDAERVARLARECLWLEIRTFPKPGLVSHVDSGAHRDMDADSFERSADAIQPFLRELRPEDLAGSAAVFRIKEQILLRAADALGPDQIKDVLIEDLIQQ